MMVRTATATLAGTGQQIVLSAPQIASTAIGIAAAKGAAWATAAIPFVGPIVAGVTLALTALFSRKGPKQKRATTEIVNQVEPLLKENLEGYLSGPRTPEARAQALANFDAAWAWLVDQCGQPAMGEPGRRCIAERQRGGSAPWCPTRVGCDWFTLYRDPIEQDTVSEGSSSTFLAPGGSGVSSAGLWMLLAGSALVAFGLFWGK